MKNNMKLRAVLILLTAMLMCFGSSVTAFAASTSRSGEGTRSSSMGSDSTISSYLGSLNSYSEVNSVGLSKVVKQSPSTGYKVYTLGDGTTVYVNEARAKTTIQSLQSQADADANAKQTADITEQDQMANKISNIKIVPDVDAASRMLSGFTPLIQMVVSVVIVAVTMGMTLFTAFDICYIEFPVFRNKCEDAKASGNKMMTRTDSKTGETKLRLVTDEAQYAIQAADTIQSGQNPLVIYFKKRFAAILILAIVLFILLTGNMNVFSQIALKLVSGIISIVQSYT